MGWFGKVVGGSWGLMFGGPIGAILGGAIGHLLFDRRSSAKKQGGAQNAEYGGEGQYGYQRYNQEQIQAAFFVAIFSMMGKVAKADGVVSEQERRLVSRLADENNLRGRERELAMRAFEESQSSAYSTRDFARQMAEMTRGREELRSTLIEMLCRLAASDSFVSREEIEAIKEAASEFRIADSAVDSMLSRYGANAGSDKDYQILGCSPSSSDAEIKAAYKKMASDYHPDRIISRGLPEEFTKFATQRFQEIQSAYDSIKKARGMR